MPISNSKAVVCVGNLRAPLTWNTSSGLVGLNGTVVPSEAYTSRDAAQLAGVLPGQQYWLASAALTKLSTVRQTTPTADNQFGRGVALNANGTLAAIGVRNGDAGGTDWGCVEMYSITPAGVFTKLYTIASKGATNGSFGFTVALSGDGTRLAVGELYAGATGLTNSGRVHLYNVTTTAATLKSTYVSPVAAANDLFNRVAFSGDGKTLAIGNPNSAGYRGHVEVLDVSNLASPVALGSVLGFPNQPELASYGAQCALNNAGTELIVSATKYRFDVVRITSKTPWTFTRQWNVGDVAGAGTLPGTNTGTPTSLSSVALSASGATLINGSQPLSGGEISVSIRSGDAITPVITAFRDAGAVDTDMFGASVAISGDGTRVLVGAPTDPTTAATSGTVYLYALNVTRQLRVMDDMAVPAGATSEAGGFVPNTGGTVTLDNLTVTTTGAGNAFTLKTVAGTMVCDLSGWCTYGADSSGSQYATSRSGVTLTTTGTHPLAWSATSGRGNVYELTLVDRTSSKVYAVTGVVGDATNQAYLKIKRIHG